jgi:hypothetical protein
MLANHSVEIPEDEPCQTDLNPRNPCNPWIIESYIIRPFNSSQRRPVLGVQMKAPTCLLVLCCISPISSIAQAQQAPALVIDGGTLIDGNGGTPVRDALIIIQGNSGSGTPTTL